MASEEDLDKITHTIAKRVARYLDRTGYLYRDAESDYLDLVPEEDDAMHRIISASSERWTIGSYLSVGFWSERPEESPDTAGCFNR